MSKTYLQNGLVYQDRTFVSKTLLLEDGKVFVLEPQSDFVLFLFGYFLCSV